MKNSNQTPSRAQGIGDNKDEVPNDDENDCDNMDDEQIATVLLVKGKAMAASSPEKNGDLFEEVVTLEEKLLSRFGLPYSVDHIFLVREFYTLHLDKRLVKRLLDFLSRRAEAAQLEVNDERNILEIASEELMNPLLVLPRLGIETHVYPLFVYRSFVFGTGTVEEALEDMRGFGRLDYDDKSFIASAHYHSDIPPRAAYDRLMSYGLKYMDAFHTFFYRCEGEPGSRVSELLDWPDETDPDASEI